MNMTLSLIIPCHNEEASIGKVIRSLPPNINEVIIIDNNSTDCTGKIAKKFGAIVIFEPKKGYGRALKAGLRRAKGDILIVFDGDGQHPSEKILPMVDYLEKNKLDFLSGNRFSLNTCMSYAGVFGNTVLTKAVNLLFGLSLKDSQSGMWVFRKVVLSSITFENDDMAFSEEIKIKVALHPLLKFEEYAIPYYPRIGKSKLLPMRHGLKNLLFLFKLKLNHARKSGHSSFPDC